MRKVWPYLLIVFLSTCFTLNPLLAGQFTDPMDGRFDASNYLAENAFGFLPVPIIITDPAVDGGLGLAGIFFHESEEAQKKRLEAMTKSENAARYLLTPSVSVVAAAKTGNDSWFVGGGHLGMFRKGDIRYLIFAGYADFNLDFHGSGEFQLPQPIEINTKASLISNSLKFRLFGTPIFVGALQKYSNSEISVSGKFDANLPDLLSNSGKRFGEIIQTSNRGEITLSGLGVSFEFDNRDNNFSPTEGYQYQIDFVNYSDSIGSDVDYYLTTFSGLNYWRFGNNIRAALKLGGEFIDTDDTLPPFALPYIELRGIPSARYQSQNVVMTEVELTFEIDNRWSMLVFTGAGRAANKRGNLNDSSTRVSNGIGFRYLIARSYGLHMGMDIARGPEDTVFYIQAGSAW